MGAFGVVNTCFQSLGPLLMGIFVGHGTLGSLKIVSELGILAFSFFLFFSLFSFLFFFFFWLVGRIRELDIRVVAFTKLLPVLHQPEAGFSTSFLSPLSHLPQSVLVS